jgi:hypothetical protein
MINSLLYEYVFEYISCMLAGHASPCNFFYMHALCNLENKHNVVH